MYVIGLIKQYLKVIRYIKFQTIILIKITVKDQFKKVLKFFN